MSPTWRAGLYVVIGMLAVATLVAAYMCADLFFETEATRRNKAELARGEGATPEAIHIEMLKVRRQSRILARVYAVVAVVLAATTVFLCTYTHYRYGWFSGVAFRNLFLAFGATLAGGIMLGIETNPRRKVLWLVLIALVLSGLSQ